MTTPDKLLVVETQDRVVGVEELGMEDHLDSVGRPVEQLDSTNLVQDRIVRVVGHVVSRDGGKGVTSKGEDSSFEENLVFLRE